MDLRETASGAVGALCLVSAGQPFDVVKARLQSARSDGRGPLRVALDAVRCEGGGALFKGFAPALASSLTENVVVWTVNAFLRRQWAESSATPDEEDTAEAHHALLGAATGACSAVSICPAEVVKVRMQTRTTRSSARAVVRELWATSGPRGFFLGLGPLLVRDVPFYFLFFGAMETYLSLAGFDPVEASPAETVMHAALSGGFAGSIAWAVVFPLDVLKTRQQVHGRGGGLLATAKELVSEGGLRAVYRGWLPAVLRGFPANAALVTGVQCTRAVLGVPESPNP